MDALLRKDVQGGKKMQSHFAAENTKRTRTGAASSGRRRHATPWPLDVGGTSARHTARSGWPADRLIYQSETRKTNFTSLSGNRVLVLGTGRRALSINEVAAKTGSALNVVGFYPGSIDELPAVPGQHILPNSKSLMETVRDLEVDEIVVAVAERRTGGLPLEDLLACRVLGVKVHELATYFEKAVGQIRLDEFQAGWLIFGEGFEQGLLRRLCKRVFDIVCAGILLILAIPVMLLTVLLIAIESGFPILYFQERTGLDGRTFKLIKFRSMCCDAEKDGKPKWASSADSRVTRIGRFIRKFRIDELPQLVNVLNGEMSLVGPRPERPYFVEQLNSNLPFYAIRHSVKPGITGWAQVRYGYCASVDDSAEKFQYDLYYVKHNSLPLDCRILLKTVGVVLSGRGAR